MKKTLAMLIVITLMVPAWASRAQAAPTGKDIFLEKKCNGCHLIKADGIEKTVNKKTGKIKKGPDLSNVGSEHDSAWFGKWLSKEVENESHFDKTKQVKHKKKFKGTDEEKKILTEWLASHKTKVTVTPEEEGANAADEEEEEKE